MRGHIVGIQVHLARDAEWLTLFENLPLNLCEVNDAASTGRTPEEWYEAKAGFFYLSYGI
jgi:hypothetical protein